MRVQSSILILARLAAVFLLALWLLQPATAAAQSSEHVRSAFLFADRKDWDNARQHASASKDPSLKKLITWLYLLDVDSGARFDEVKNFITANPQWPEQKKLAIRAEAALRDDKPEDAQLIAWFTDRPPITGVGKIAFAQALERTGQGTREKIIYLLRDAWRNGDFDPSQEADFLSSHADVLTREDESIRVDRLLWEGKLSAAERMLERVSGKEHTLFAARIALQNEKNISQAMNLLSDEMRKDPGLTYDLIRYYVRSDQDEKARALLTRLPTHLPYPDKWWKLREAQVRRAIDEQNYTEANRLLEGYEQLTGSDFADASWLKGWLMQEFLKKPSEARNAFARMYENVRYPVSKSRAGYWAARAAEDAGDEQSAKTWYANAAAFSTTFYGQLASLKLSQKAPLLIPSPPKISAEKKREFQNSDIAKAVVLCAQNDQTSLAAKLLALIIEGTEDEVQIVAAGELGKQIGRPNLGVRVAKKALQQNIVLIDVGYPRPHMSEDLAVEKPLALAITRQESEFDPLALSKAGATGMMQLLPSTAKEVAKKAAVGFNRMRLREPAYNMMLGSHYLARLLRSYDGSYVKAIAAYNAGPGNVRKWVQEFGEPGNTPEAAIDWIEKIPFYETRNYVQRVLENLQIYRQLEAKEQAPLMLADDLVR